MELRKMLKKHKSNNNLIRLSAIEINITETCNFCCKGCDHSMGIISKRHISISQISSDLCRISDIVKTKTLRIVGGEPLLHPNLINILRLAKQSINVDSLELWTNAALLDQMPDHAWSLIDGVIISKYPEKEYKWDMQQLKKYANKYNVWFHVRNCSLFKWSYSSNKNSNRLAKILHTNCLEAGADNTVRDGKFYKCVQCAFAYDRLLANGIKIQDDGISIHNNPRVREQISLHLWSEKPLNACYYCLGELGAYFPHKDLSQKKETDTSEPEFDPQLILPDSFI